MKFALYVFGLISILSSGTIVTTTNLPGKQAKTFPKGLIGSYELKYPSSMDGLMDGTEGTTVEITKTTLTMTTGDQVNKMILNDSIFYSTIEKQGYISMGAAPDYTVLRVVKTGKDFELYMMNIVTECTVDNLKGFFKEVKEVSDVNEDGEQTTSYNVTIDDAKLDAYFKSSYVDNNPFKLIRKK